MDRALEQQVTRQTEYGPVVASCPLTPPRRGRRPAAGSSAPAGHDRLVQFLTPGALVHVGPAGADEATELALAPAMLRRAADGELTEAIHVYSPTTPAVVFGRRDTRLPGFPTAVAAARRMGFDVAVRASGGRAVAYTQNTLVIDHVRHDPASVGRLQERFVTYGQALADAFTALGIDARMGEVPGEYCPGAHSVNARGMVKLVGTAQRVVKDAWLFSSVIVVEDRAVLQDVLGTVYAAMDLPFDPASVGAVREENPQLTRAEVRSAVAEVWGLDAIAPTPLAGETLDLAHRLVADHRLD